MAQQTKFVAVVLTLVGAAVAAVVLTWIGAYLLLGIGVRGLPHMVALMVIMPLSFGIIALFIARRVLLR